jgi:hypothetical protein
MSYHKDPMFPNFQERQLTILKEYDERIKSGKDIRFSIQYFKGLEYYLFVICIKYQLYSIATWYFNRSIEKSHKLRFESVPVMKNLHTIHNIHIMDFMNFHIKTPEKLLLVKTILPYLSEKYINYIFHSKYVGRDDFYSVPLIQRFIDYSLYSIAIDLIENNHLLQKKMIIKQSHGYQDKEYNVYYQFITTFLLSSEKNIQEHKEYVYPFIIKNILPMISDLDKYLLNEVFRLCIQTNDTTLYEHLLSMYPHVMNDNDYLYYHFINRIVKEEVLYEKYRIHLFEYISFKCKNDYQFIKIIQVLFFYENKMPLHELENLFLSLLQTVQENLTERIFFSFHYIREYFEKNPNEEYYDKIYIQGLKMLFSYKILNSYDEPVHNYQPYYTYLIKNESSINRNKIINLCIHSLKERYQIPLQLNVYNHILQYILLQ